VFHLNKFDHTGTAMLKNCFTYSAHLYNILILYLLAASTMLLFSAPVFAQAPKLRFKHLSNEQGLSNSTVEVIYQDSRGFMWFGTRDGLNRYDGIEMVIYKNDPADSNSLSDSYIRCIYEDSDHNLWVGTINGLNKLNANTNRFTRYKYKQAGDGALSEKMITSLAEDHEGNLWIGTYGGGINVLNKKSQRFNRLQHTGSDAGSLADDRVNFIIKDKSNNLWIGTEAGLNLYNNNSHRFTRYLNPADTTASANAIRVIQQNRQGNLWLGTKDNGLYLFDPLHNSFTRYTHLEKDPGSLGNNMIKSLLADKKGNLWAGTINGGLNLFNPLNNSFYHYYDEPGNTTSLSQRTISALFEDNQGNLWIGTHRGGINCYSPGLEKFNLYRQELYGNSVSYNDVKAFCEDGNGNIWIGTDGGGLNLFVRDSKTFVHYKYDPFNNSSLGANAVLHVMQDRKGNIWVSTWGGGLNLMDKRTGTFTRFQHNPNDSNSISSNFVQQVYEDYKGDLWVGTYYGGLNIFNPSTGKFRRLQTDPTNQTALTGKNIVSICEDKESNIWIGTDDGGLNCYNQTTRHFSHYFNNEERMPDLRVIFADSKGRIWVGQKGLYLFDAVHNRFTLYTDKGGLNTEFIKGIAEDEQGNFWVATSNGLTRFNPDAHMQDAFKKYNTADGLQGLEFEANAYLKTRNGEMYFGGINGFNSFYPANIKTNQFIPPVYITGFQLFNKKVTAGENKSPLPYDLSVTKEITLSYRQATFLLQFAALDYTAPGNNHYAWKMEGLDKDWNYAGKETKANYTNLAPGEYTFRVKASNNDGVWNEEGAAIRIIITPPFWKARWFIILLIMLAAAGLYWFYKFKTKLKLKELEERKKEEMHQMQLQFFTNISHEFRTPLTLIVGPLEKLMNENGHPTFRHYYNIMHRNAHRLLNLITELMDFGKIESGSLHLRVTKGNLRSFLEEIAEEFMDWAGQKEITFTLHNSATASTTWFDRQVMEKIVLNLLHNSFKYTKNGGAISVELMDSLNGFTPSYENELVIKNDIRGKSYAYIRVTDTGIGISKASLQYLFERYYRITESHLGSGVGLAFVKSLTKLHKGDVYVFSEHNKGTEIIIAIPVDENDYKKEEKKFADHTEARIRLESLNSWPEHQMDLANKTTAPVNGLNNGQVPSKLILLVEDNEELRQFLKDHLSPFYKIAEAADGQEAFTKAKELIPNLIISDVIMPGMNGIELCRAIKQDLETSHIPFIMLTAKSAVKSQVEGLGSGADHYFSKPLNFDLLLLSIRNIFNQGVKLKEHYSRAQHIEAMDLVHSESDREFMNHVLQIIDSQMADPAFDIDQLCTGMGMSRTKLYQKIKSISGQAVGDFIRSIRLKKAVQILTHEEVTITEVMYRIGIQTQSYFTKAFKKEFGKTPSQFIQEVRKK
jgi:ligand-binding sensor domain-containing protein/signal transduction histidine kinase/CheY-like chemotaxis protein/AraC-like DNA-binding protein